ncbi:sentrin-specific protease 8-like isoform X2 [Halichondria panicea]|uniref:sentrin-specific protease 8-like isoform X2 n=1 Tax=Halichondria panicea TaxID=6063 RepID=UPI00312BAB35
MASSMQDKVALSYYDSLLRESDVALLIGANWINDKIIGFYFEYLEHELFSDNRDQVCFITPDVTQFIKIYNGPELSMFLDPLGLSDKDLVLLAVNNNASSEHSGGSHWSLLVYVRKENTFYSWDSCHSLNLLPSQQCAQKVTPFLSVPSQPVFSEVPSCPQQTNGNSQKADGRPIAPFVVSEHTTTIREIQ